MRHPFRLVAISVLLFTFAFWLGSWGGRQLGPGFKGVSSQPAVPPSPSPAPGTQAASATPQTAKTLLQQRDSGRLFSLLFDGGVLAGVPSAQLVPVLRLRFAAPLPGDSAEREREIVRRVGILKALDRSHRKGGEPELFAFYRELLGEGSFLIRRQALRNLSFLLATRPEGERRQVLREAGARVLASAALSDDELLEQVFHETR